MTVRDIRLWVDDDFVDRAAPEGWTHVASVHEAVTYLAAGRVCELSLDNDLNDPEETSYDVAVSGEALQVRESLAHPNPGAGQGKLIVQWLEFEHGAHGRDHWPARIVIHSGNATARDQMRAGIRAGARRAGHELAEGYTPGGKPEFHLS